jgi:hypothetical protein
MMNRCEVCGNEYDKAFQIITSGGQSHTFDGSVANNWLVG